MRTTQTQPQRNFNALPQYAKCVLNPFDMPACGYPDYFNEPTVKIKLSETFTVMTDANGNFSSAVGPALARSYGTNTITGTTTGATTTWQAHADLATLTASAYWARTVCFGVKIDYVGNVMNAAGTLCVTKEYGGAYSVSSSINSMADDGDCRPAVEGRVVPMLPSQPARYEAFDATSVTFSAPTFQYLYLTGIGLPASTTVLRITVVRHVEFLPTRSSSLVRDSASATPGDPNAFVAISGVQNAVQSTSETWQSTLSSAAKDAWSSIYASAKPLMIEAGRDALIGGMAMLAL